MSITSWLIKNSIIVVLLCVLLLVLIDPDCLIAGVVILLALIFFTIFAITIERKMLLAEISFFVALIELNQPSTFTVGPVYIGHIHSYPLYLAVLSLLTFVISFIIALLYDHISLLRKISLYLRGIR